MSGLITVIRGGAKTAPKKAPTFFSRVDEAAKELPRTKGTGKEFMAELKKQPGVKKAELDDRKLAELESAPKMTKQEFIQKLEQKPTPKIDESIKAHPTDVDLDEMAMKLIDDKADEMTEQKLGKRAGFNRYDWDDYQEGVVQYLKNHEYDKYLREAKRNIEENVGADFPKYEDYKLPGGENYREILLKLPSSYGEGSALAKEIRDLGYRGRIEDLNASTIRAFGGSQDLQNRWMNAIGAGTYRSGHWDEPNVLAHIRVQDRVGPNGEKILHVEEIQSDWHQAGRKKGYENPEVEARRKELEKLAWPYMEANKPIPAELKAEIDALPPIMEKGVPDAPFKKNWHELATKRIMNYAIENGYDKVAITPGAEQASRYDLSKHIDTLTYHPEKKRLVAFDPNLNRVLERNNVDPEQIADFVGKDVAKRLIESPRAESTGHHSISGQDLRVGGEGMIGFYDQILPAYINKEYGKYGANIGRHDIPVPPKNSMDVQEYTLGPEYISGQATWDELLKANPRLAKEYAVPLHSFDITPEMRETIQSKGQPLYQAAGIGLTGAAAAPSEEKVQISDNPDTMMLELQDQGFAGGGLLKKAVKAIRGTQEVLPAAEREANLAKMLEKSSVKKRVYHGTESKDDYSKDSKGNDAIKSFAGQSTWVAEEPYTSHGYAGKSGYVMPLHVKLEKPLTINHIDANDEASNIFDIAKGIGVDIGHLKSMSDPEKVWEVINHPYFIDAASNAGFDGISIKEGGRQTHSVFNPGNIKSAIGNRGTYDLTDPDINKAVGGLTKAKRK